MTATATQPVKRLIHRKATEPQRAFWRSNALNRLFVGGVGSGKTRAGCVEVLRQPPRTTGMVLAPTYPMLRDATLVSFLELAQRGGILRSFNKAEMIAQLSDSKTVLFRSADDPDRLRGPNLAWFYLDEAALMDETVWPIMLGRLRLAPGRAWATSTPRGYNWLYEVFTKGGADYAIIRSSTRQNPFLPANFVRSLEHAYDSQWLAQEVEGEFVDLGAIDHFLPSIALWDACQEPLPPLDRHTPCILAMDAGESNDAFATVLISRHPADPARPAVRYARAYVPKGAPLDFDAIEQDIRGLVARYAVQEIAYDPFLLGQMMRRLSAPGKQAPTVLEPFSQGSARLEADKLLFDLITQRRIAHDGDPDLRQHLANADKKLDADGRKLRIIKRRHEAKIDLAVALSMGCARALTVLDNATGFSFAYDEREKRGLR